ncbi:hypothetical protein Nepgr_025384 [Nepenthes gracilis]|uniref:Uncharacterized protein n=1 Tax=Nepenthes gracilis TaxID=150966 RepID=A0AAD3T7N9_NEPGR|nr:hypothetical protein Nepgr_025384 [Nepenthes gracilis]
MADIKRLQRHHLGFASFRYRDQAGIIVPPAPANPPPSMLKKPCLCKEEERTTSSRTASRLRQQLLGKDSVWFHHQEASDKLRSERPAQANKWSSKAAPVRPNINHYRSQRKSNNGNQPTRHHPTSRRDYPITSKRLKSQPKKQASKAKANTKELPSRTSWVNKMHHHSIRAIKIGKQSAESHRIQAENSRSAFALIAQCD